MKLLIKHWKTPDYLIKAVPQNYGNRCLPAVSYLLSTLLYIQKNGSWRWFQNRLQLAFVLCSWLRSINMLFSFITPFKISLEFKNVLVFSILSNTIEYMPHSQLRCRAFFWHFHFVLNSFSITIHTWNVIKIEEVNIWHLVTHFNQECSDTGVYSQVGRFL